MIDSLINQGSCPEGYEALFHHMWNGTKEFCLNDGSQLRLVERQEGIECSGEVIQSIAPINMTVISGKIACGKRGGPTFI